MGLFYRLKKACPNSVVYNFSYKKISQLTGASEKTARKYVRELMEFSYDAESCENQKNQHIFGRETRRIVAIKDGNLHLANTQPRTHLCTIKFKKDTSVDGITNLLYGKRIDQLKRIQEHNIKVKTENKRLISSPKNYKEAKKRSTLLRYGTTVTPKIYDVKMGIRYLTEELNISERKLRAIIHGLTSTGIMTVESRLSCVKKCSRDLFEDYRDDFIRNYGHCWWFKGRVYSRGTNLYHQAIYLAR